MVKRDDYKKMLRKGDEKERWRKKDDKREMLRKGDKDEEMKKKREES